MTRSSFAHVIFFTLGGLNVRYSVVSVSWYRVLRSTIMPFGQGAWTLHQAVHLIIVIIIIFCLVIIIISFFVVLNFARELVAVRFHNVVHFHLDLFSKLRTLSYPTVAAVMNPHHIASQNPFKNAGGISSGFSAQSLINKWINIL